MLAVMHGIYSYKVLLEWRIWVFNIHIHVPSRLSDWLIDKVKFTTLSTLYFEMPEENYRTPESHALTGFFTANADLYDFYI